MRLYLILEVNQKQNKNIGINKMKNIKTMNTDAMKDAELRVVDFHNNDGIYCHDYRVKTILSSWWVFHEQVEARLDSDLISIKALIDIPFYIDRLNNDLYTIKKKKGELILKEFR